MAGSQVMKVHTESPAFHQRESHLPGGQGQWTHVRGALCHAIFKFFRQLLLGWRLLGKKAMDVTMMMIPGIKSLLPPSTRNRSCKFGCTDHVALSDSDLIFFPFSSDSWSVAEAQPLPQLTSPLQRLWRQSEWGGNRRDSPFVLLAEFYIYSVREITARDFLMEIFF